MFRVKFSEFQMVSAYKSLEYIRTLLRSGKRSAFLEGVIANPSFELNYLEYFFENLYSKENGTCKMKQAIDDIPSDEVIDMAHHHWRSWMSEFTAYWILGTRLGYDINAFDVQSPYRTREKSNCDALCTKNGGIEYVEVKSAHDWTRYSAPRAIVELCKSVPGHSYVIATNREKFVVTNDLLSHIRKELDTGKEYLGSLVLDSTYSIYSLDNRVPHDVEIMMRKERHGREPVVALAFPPRNDEDFAEWLQYRILESNEKGATLLFVNYIFWTEEGRNPSVADFLKQRLPGLKESPTGLWLTSSTKGSVRETFVFMPSGVFEPIRIEATNQGTDDA